MSPAIGTRFARQPPILFIYHSLINFTFRKNKPPAGRNTRCDPGWFFSSVPSLYQCMMGIGEPSALQFNVTGSWRGTVVSIGCSIILGICRPAREQNKRELPKKYLLKPFLIQTIITMGTLCFVDGEKETSV